MWAGEPGSRASSPKSTQPGSNKQHLSRAVRSSEAERCSPASVARQSSGRRPGAVSPAAASCQDANAQQMFRSLLPRSPEGPEKVVPEKRTTNPNPEWESEGFHNRKQEEGQTSPGSWSFGSRCFAPLEKKEEARKEGKKTCGPNRA